MKMSREKVKLLASLFLAFFRISPASFGGGYAMTPAIEREVVDKQRWIDRDEFAVMVSLSGMAPGGFGVNAAAFVGQRKAGFLGAIAAVAGMTLPTFLLILAGSYFYISFQNHPKVEAALSGVKGAVVALIAMAAYRMAKASIFDKSTAVLSIIGFLLLFESGVHPIYVILFGLIAGIVLVKIKNLIGMKVQTEKTTQKEPHSALIYPEYYI